MTKILMVCLGNICRSPLAEGIMRHKALKANLDIVVDSAGTASYHQGEPPHKSSVRVAREHGIDISHLRARAFRKEDFNQFDIIYAMDNDNYLNILKMSAEQGHHSKVRRILSEIDGTTLSGIPDPWYGTYKDFEEVFDLLDEVCSQIVDRFNTSTDNL